MKKWKVTLTNEELSRASVWVDADTNDEAEKKAFEETKIKDFIKDYEGLYAISIIAEDQIYTSKFKVKDNRK